MRCFIILSVISVFLTSCSTGVEPKHITTTDWNKATQQVVSQYSPDSDKALKPTFNEKHVAYPPKQVTLLTFKKERRMELWAKNQNNQQWQYIKSYDLTAFSGKPGPKLKYHDGQIPEGVYNITMLNPFSSWQLSMLINYPNSFDKEHAKIDGRDKENLGGDIYIHGNNLSVGCLAIGDESIDELFVLIARVGPQHARVIIAPNDLRKQKPVTNLKKQPQWVPELYAQLKKELTPFDPKTMLA
jgi:murein L,D-transpeptidase YafK